MARPISHNAPFGLHRETGDQPHSQDVPGAVFENRARQQVSSSGPCDRFECRGRELRTQSHQPRREAGGKRGECFGAWSPTEQTREGCIQQHEPDGGDRCRQAQQTDALAEYLRGCGDQRNERGLIYIPEIRPPPAGEKVQFVAVGVVPALGREMNDGHTTCNEPHTAVSMDGGLDI